MGDIVHERRQLEQHRAGGLITGERQRDADAAGADRQPALPSVGGGEVCQLAGGVIAEAWLVTYADGTRMAGKTQPGAPAEVSDPEGLDMLRVTGHLQTPQVLAVTRRLLLLEALQPRDDSVASW